MAAQDDHELDMLLDEARVTRAGFLRAGAAAGALTTTAAAPAVAARGRTREYWVGAVPVTWNLVPNGRNAIEGQRYTAAETTMRTVLYREFSAGWRKQLPPRRGLGSLGPLIRADLGDRIRVHFKNLDEEFGRPHSMHFHGVEYGIESDGSYLPLFSGAGANVKPGESFTYRLTAGGGSVGSWPYHDHSPSMMDSIHGGLYGALSIRDPRKRRPAHEFTVFFGEHQGFMTINGRAFVGNTPVFRARIGDLVQWNVLTLGDQFHTFHIHGHRWRQPDGTSVDTRTLGPAESFSLRFREDAPGTWLYHCHVESHMLMGMIGLYRVERR